MRCITITNKGRTGERMNNESSARHEEQRKRFTKTLPVHLPFRIFCIKQASKKKLTLINVSSIVDKLKTKTTFGSFSFSFAHPEIL